ALALHAHVLVDRHRPGSVDMHLDAMQDRIAERLSGRLVSLERLGPEHVEGLRRAGADPAVWRWMVVDNVDDWLEDSIDPPDRGSYTRPGSGAPRRRTSLTAVARE